MLCDICREKPATIHMTKVVNNQVAQVNLCPECANKHGALHFNLGPKTDIPNFLAGLFHGDQFQQWAPPEDDKCPNCGFDYNKFTGSGLMGCNKCYDKFCDRTDPLLRKIHGSNRHGGKVPLRTGGHMRIKTEINSLKSQLQEAVAREEFERAAELRDKIKELENQ